MFIADVVILCTFTRYFVVPVDCLIHSAKMLFRKFSLECTNSRVNKITANVHNYYNIRASFLFFIYFH